LVLIAASLNEEPYISVGRARILAVFTRNMKDEACGNKEKISKFVQRFG
jgi:hypothetical protein